MTLSHFAYHSLYKTQKEYWRSWNFGFSEVFPNLIEVISLNPVNSGDSNGIIYVSIPALGDENRNFPCFCLPALPWKSPRRIGSYHTSLERVGIATYGCLGCFHRLCRKGDGSSHWKYVWRSQESQVNIGLLRIFPITPLPHIEFWTNLVSTERYHRGLSNAT